MHTMTVPPWYTQRWPWFLMLGPVTVVIGGSFAAWLAVTRPDAMVVDDYYKKGKAINQDLRRDRVASSLRLEAELRFDPATGRLAGSVTSFGRPTAGPLHIYLAHPTQPAKDQQLLVVPDASGQFSVAVPMLERAHWQVVIEGSQREWRLAKSWSWPRERAIAIHADAQ